MKLSILICSHESRMPLCYRMKEHITRQILEYGYLMGVEVLVQENTSVKQRGADRNTLLDRATGKFCCFVDDDDVVALNYVDLIIRAISQPENIDCDIFGVHGIVTSLASNEVIPFELSIMYPEIFSLPSDNIQDGFYKRFASHLNPVKTEIARKIKFPDEMINEDNGYSRNLKEYISTNPLKETTIQECLYYYYNRCNITSKGVRT